MLLNATIEEHLGQHESEVTDKLKDDINVDNVVTGTNEGSAIHFYKDAITMFKDASMHLREWISNSDTVNECITKEDRASSEDISILGHMCDHQTDTIAIKQPTSTSTSDVITKRNVFKNIASVFNPLGLFAPVLVRGMLLLQDLWSIYFDWDDIIENEEIIKQWLTIQQELEVI